MDSEETETEGTSWRWNRHGLSMDCQEAQLIRAGHLCCVNNFKLPLSDYAKQREERVDLMNIYVNVKKGLIHFPLPIYNIFMKLLQKPYYAYKHQTGVWGWKERNIFKL